MYAAQIAKSKGTQGLVIEVLRRRPAQAATPVQVIQTILLIDDRRYSADAVRGAINTLLSHNQLVLRGGEVALLPTKETL
jgi:hypothetical protein